MIRTTRPAGSHRLGTTGAYAYLVLSGPRCDPGIEDWLDLTDAGEVRCRPTLRRVRDEWPSIGFEGVIGLDLEEDDA